MTNKRTKGSAEKLEGVEVQSDLAQMAYDILCRDNPSLPNYGRSEEEHAIVQKWMRSYRDKP